MKKFCLDCIRELDTCSPREFGRIFVQRRMEFFWKYRLVCSTATGADFFQILVECIEGKRKWLAKDPTGKGDDHPGEYEDNFRKLIKMGQNDA